MNKKGFTLIELLAVIVILAIIALIATPIVLDIIADSKKSADLRSAEFYLDAVEYAIAREVVNGEKIETNTYNIMSNGDICLEYNAENECIKPLKIDVKGKKPTSGTIKIGSGEISDISLNIENKVVVKDDKGNLAYKDDITICTLASDSTKTGNEIGAKYECKVDPNKDVYIFHVVSNNDDGTTNLILNNNICADGTLATSSNVCPACWGSTTQGPTSAMEHVYNATKSWTNVTPLNYEYKDNEFQGYTAGYTSFISANGVAQIKNSSGGLSATIGTSDSPLRARMPIYTNNEANLSKNEVSAKNADNAYLFENNPRSGYWTLSTCNIDPGYYQWYVGSGGEIYGLTSGDCYEMGVRPVITIKL